jgi:hypothetical protein
MTSGNGQGLLNLILLVLAITWMFKIAFHFGYLRSLGIIKETKFISFFVNLENLFWAILIVSPFFFVKRGFGMEMEERKVKGLTLSAYALWLVFAVTFYYLYRYPPPKGI